MPGLVAGGRGFPKTRKGAKLPALNWGAGRGHSAHFRVHRGEQASNGEISVVVRHGTGSALSSEGRQIVVF